MFSISKRFNLLASINQKKTTKEIAEITGISLRGSQHIIKTWKDSGEPSTSRDKCGREKTLKFSGQISLKRLVKKTAENHSRTQALFNTGHRGISTRTMRRELKRMELNSCGPTKNHLFRRLAVKNVSN
ncbi:hypothetical protein AVEN_129724-1 [Araneus ventricosus]|uniref:Transposase Tc1-like domain-containing protein n=1 Tax=Araneus ventricosus TaxID=182803 RepID=A0A4Y2DHX1_ARAVE|nr:hypothetical protein AVEN_129724-1 [Araneus ventricosus]